MAVTQTKLIGLLCVFLCIHCSSVFSLQCLDANGNPVDWYMTYKLPKLEEHSSWMFKDGLAHMYLDLHSPFWSLSKYAMNDTRHAVYNTLQQMYSSQGDSLFYLMYNDEGPHELRLTETESGHSKGVAAFDKKTGFWLSHSVPKFPPRKSQGYTWQESGSTYGQSFLCISISYDKLGQLGQQFMFNEPHIYDYFIPDDIGEDYPVLQDLVKRKKLKGPPYFSVISLSSMSGQVFRNFAKSGKLKEDLYKNIVSKYLNSDLLVESWMNGSGGKLPSNCTLPYKVFDVENVTLPGGASFGSHKDHSKWTISYSKDLSLRFHSEQETLGDNWTCVGDINRMHSQWHRGGGTTCIQDAQVWKAFRSSVKDYQRCGSIPTF